MFKILIITFACMLTLSWAIYVPEYVKSSRNYASVNGRTSLRFDKNNALKSDLQEQSVKKYHYVYKYDDNNNDGQQKLITTKYTKTIEEQQQQTQPLLYMRVAEKSYDVVYDDDVVNSKNRTSKNQHKNLEAQPTGFAEPQQQQQLQRLQRKPIYNNDVTVIEEEANDNDSLLTLLKHSRQKRQLSDFLMAPNTRWCGRGNTANGTYNHLGGASMADKCCRTHDHCKLYIPPMSSRFDIFNYRLYTLSHCNCDRRFRTCLKMANDEDANTIGEVFFNLVQMECFVLAKEVVCQQRAADGTCLKEDMKQKAYLRNNKKY